MSTSLLRNPHDSLSNANLVHLLYREMAQLCGNASIFYAGCLFT
jgi:hypothetical protein